MKFFSKAKIFRNYYNLQLKRRLQMVGEGVRLIVGCKLNINADIVFLCLPASLTLSPLLYSSERIISHWSLLTGMMDNRLPRLISARPANRSKYFNSFKVMVRDRVLTYFTSTINQRGCSWSLLGSKCLSSGSKAKKSG